MEKKEKIYKKKKIWGPTNPLPVPPIRTFTILWYSLLISIYLFIFLFCLLVCFFGVSVSVCMNTHNTVKLSFDFLRNIWPIFLLHF